MKKLTLELRQKIGYFLGRDVPASEEGQLNSFADFSENDEKELRRLHMDKLLAITYISFRLRGGARLDVLVSYHSEVIGQGIPFEKWNASRNR